jgi:phosphoribosylglycinamide formyltransferase-1
MTKKLKLNVDNDEIKQAILNYFEGKDIKITNSENPDLTVFFGDIEDNSLKANTINIHPSLLPAFPTNDAIKESYLSGVKVSGITIHYVEPDNFYGRIIAQYPVLIGNNTHFDEFEKEIIKLCAKFAPQVIDTVINDKVFDFSQLYQPSSPCQKQGGCRGCKGCHN